MMQKEILDLFKKTGSILEGHFLLSSGLHSDRYLQCALLLQYPQYAEKLCGELAKKFSGRKIDTVAGPALGGVVVSYEVARHLKARSIFTERENGKMMLRRGFSVKKAEEILVVEDVITTGSSVNEVMKLLTESGAKIVGLGAIVDRTKESTDFFGNVKLESLIKVSLDTYKPDNCPLCKTNIPLVKPGSRKVGEK